MRDNDIRKKWFVVGDVHGEYDLLEKLLMHWDQETENLIFLGDLADRGPKSKACFEKVLALVNSGQARCIKGNHEVMFLEWLENPEERYLNYLRNGGKETIEDLLFEDATVEQSPQELAAQIKEQYPELLAGLKALPFYIEEESFICVHAGINLDLEDWRETSERDFVWMREEFFNHPERPDKRVIFGHTPVQTLHEDQTSTLLWYRDGRWNIDGGAAYGGALHGLVISEQGIEADYQIFHPKHNWDQNVEEI